MLVQNKPQKLKVVLEREKTKYLNGKISREDAETQIENVWFVPREDAKAQSFYKNINFFFASLRLCEITSISQIPVLSPKHP